MDRLLENKVAIVTGGGQGLGRAIAAALAVDGARVMVVSRSEDKARGAVDLVTSAGGAAACCVGDLRTEGFADAVVDAARSAFGGVDILVNSAGVFLWKPFLEITIEEWKESIDVNLTGAFLMTRSAARVLVDQGRGGSIINISSVHGVVPDPNVVPQCASKAGLIGLTRSVAEALRPHDVRVNAVAPGSITPDSGGVRGDSPRNPVTQADVATLVVFLASDLARSITGSVIDAFGSTRTVIKV